jgi:hypothetical protein
MYLMNQQGQQTLPYNIKYNSGYFKSCKQIEYFAVNLGNGFCVLFDCMTMYIWNTYLYFVHNIY